ncbi:MAG: GlsB/YeaQ/YmgE family stress response membrane protein [Pseudomonadota bacterium]
MSWLTFIIVGLLAGWVAGLLMRGHGLGIVLDIVVGILGAVVGGLIFSLLGITADSFLGWLVAAIIGAVVVLFVVNALAGWGGRGRGRYA